MCAAFANNAGQIKLRVLKLIYQGLIAHSFFNRVEIGTLHVLNNCNFKRFPIAYFQQ